MKKILVLLVCLGTFGALNAQSNKEEARRVVLGQKKNDRTVSDRNRDIILGDGNRNDDRIRKSDNTSISQVNRDYERKIRSIRNNSNLSRAEKERIIRQLENDRNKKLRQLRNDGKNDRYKKNKKYKSNKGKHKGWSKGKGNKHRDRDDD